MFEVAVEGALVAAVVGQKAGGLAVLQLGVEQEAVGHRVLGDQFFLVEGVQRQSRGAGVLEAQGGVELLGERRG